MSQRTLSSYFAPPSKRRRLGDAEAEAAGGSSPPSPPPPPPPPGAAGSSSQSVAGGDAWACAACTLFNDERSSCSACGTQRSTGGSQPDGGAGQPGSSPPHDGGGASPRGGSQQTGGAGQPGSARGAAASAAERATSFDASFAAIGEDPAKRAQLGQRLDTLASSREERAEAMSEAAPTPLEVQVQELKAKHPGVLLAIEVGYKYMFYGEDATVASRVLSIVAYPKHCFLCASVPNGRISIHVRRLAEAGHKVGLVRQVETAALKAASSSRGSTFKRELSRLWTKSTLIGLEDEAGGADGGTQGNSLRHLVAVAEDGARVDLVAVDVSTRSVRWASFDDGPGRALLRAALEQSELDVVEILLPAEGLSEQTARTINAVVARSANSPRVERLPADAWKLSAASQGGSAGLGLPDGCISCLGALHCFLGADGCKLTSALALSQNYRQILQPESATAMSLASEAIVDLELLVGSDGDDKSSLLHLLDRCASRGGSRRLRAMILAPLSSLLHARQRIAAVRELSTNGQGLTLAIARLQNLYTAHLSKRTGVDLERGIAKVATGACSPVEFLRVLGALSAALDAISEQSRFATECLTALLVENSSWSALGEKVAAMRQGLKHDFKGKTAGLALFVDPTQYPAVDSRQTACDEIEEALEQLLSGYQAHCPSAKYVTVAVEEYLVEMPKSLQVLSDWRRHSIVKKTLARWKVPAVQSQLARLNQEREHMARECATVFSGILQEFVQSCEEEAVALCSALSEFDAFLALAQVASQADYCFPEFVDSPSALLEIRAGSHPMAKTKMESFVPNDLTLSAEQSVLLVTGPNMGGKSSLMRAAGLLTVMASLGSAVPAASMRLTAFDAIFTRMGGQDDIFRGTSTFLNECETTAKALQHATSKSLALMDEVGRGTSTFDGTAIADAVVRSLAARSVPTIFVTHFASLAGLAGELAPVSTAHMTALVDEPEGDEIPAVTFLYKLAPGSAPASHGLNVARLAGIPAKVVATASERAAALEQEAEQRKHLALLRKVMAVDDASGAVALSKGQ